MKRGRAFGLGVAAVLLAACQVIVGIEHVPKDPPTADDGGKVGSDPCHHAFPPELPANDDSKDEIGPLFLAAVDLSFLNGTARGVAGYDLDKSCTCDKRPGTAFDGGPPCLPPASGKEQCDPDGGLDNAALTLFQQFNVVEQVNAKGASIDDAFRNDANNGIRDVLLYIKGWNGKKNDTDVQVYVFVSNGATKIPIDLDGGTGEWSYPSSLQVNSGTLQPAAPTASGYVSNGTLVVALNGGVTILLGSAGLTFNDAIIIGDLSIESNGIAKFEGVLGGRIKAGELLTTAAQFKIGGDRPACQDSSFSLIKSFICAAPDIMGTNKQDFKGNICDSISSSIALTALTTNIGGEAPKDPTPDPTANPCAPGSVDPNLYKCN